MPGELETDLRLLLIHLDLHLHQARGGDGPLPHIGEVRLERVRRAAAWIASNELVLRSRGLLSFGEKVGDLHLAPALEDALLAALARTAVG